MIASVEIDVFALDLAPAAKLGTKSKIAVEPNYIGILIYKKGTLQNCKVPFWSGKRDSNSRPRPIGSAFSNGVFSLLGRKVVTKSGTFL